MRSTGVDLKKNFLATGISRAIGVMVAVFSVFALSLAVVSASPAADAPQWSSGFPRLVEKNALLQWNPVTGAAEYNVYRTETEGKGLKLIATVKPNRHIDKELSAGKTFYYYVTAVADGKEGARSAAGAVVTPKEKAFVPLKAPTIAGGHVKSLPGDKVSVGIRWEGAAGSELIGVNIYRTTTSGKGYVMIGSSSSDSFEDADIKPGTTYYYAASSVDSNFKETERSRDYKVDVPLPAKAAKAGEAAPESKEVKPTKMKPAKLLFTIPRDAEDPSKIRIDETTPANCQDVAVDEAVGHIYVTSLGYGGVLVYNMDGDFQFGIRRDGADGKEKFGTIRNVAVGEGGNIYVADYSYPDVMVFDFRGRPVDKLTISNSHIPKYKDRAGKSYGLAIDPADGTLYVCDPASNSVHVYDRKMKRLYDITGVSSKEEAAKDKKMQLFNGPTFITLTRDREIVFVDSGWVKLMVYARGGKFLRSISRAGMSAGDLYYPAGVTTGKDGEILVASAATPNIQAFSMEGEFLYALCNEKCDGPVAVGSMRGIYADGNNRIYITEGELNRVSVYQLEDRLVEVTPPE